jgi:Cu/Ag efflux pump CusA
MAVKTDIKTFAAIGTGVIGGMLAATFIAIFFVPMFFRLLTRDRARTENAPAEPQPAAAE